jgi:VanZ family protein
MAINAAKNWQANAVAWGPAVGWMALIFGFSTDYFSSSNTAPVFGSLLTSLFPGVTAETLAQWHLLMRKLGHWTEYFILAVLVLRALTRSNLSWRFIGTAVFVFLFALSDEWHQAFVPSRSASFADVLLDTFGGICGVGFKFLRHRQTQTHLPDRN